MLKFLAAQVNLLLMILKTILLVWLVQYASLSLATDTLATNNLATDNPVKGSPTKLPSLVSTNLCADILALSLAQPQQLLSVSHKSQDARRSSYAKQALQYPANSGSAEEIIQLKPDIVLASRRWKQHPQKALFKSLGIKIVVVPLAETWEDITRITTDIAKAINRQQKGKNIVVNLQQRLANLKKASQHHSGMRVLYLRANGGTAGINSFVNSVFSANGLINHAQALGIRRWGRTSLESVIANPPDAFLVTDFVRDQAYANAAISRHPRLQQLMHNKPLLTLPAYHWSCSTWQLIVAAEQLQDQLKAIGLNNVSAD